MTRRAGVAIAIDFGEITTALGGVLGMAKGMADQKTTSRAVRRITEGMTGDFGKYIDALGAEGELAHVYEYGREGRSDPSSRLWRVHWTPIANGRAANVFFKTAKGVERNEQLESRFPAVDFAGHRFPNKAKHLETTRVIISDPGVRRHTTRVGGVANPQVLVFIGRDGRVVFSRRRRQRANEFYRKFQTAFASYWVDKMNASAMPRLKQAYVGTATFGAREVRRSVDAARMASTPRAPAGVSGLIVRDRGRPYAGIRLRGSDITKIQKPVAKRLEKELIRQWKIRQGG